jgi:AraC family transcriptional activator of pobA
MDHARNFLYISNMSNALKIRSYNLFGETDELADVLHVETIRSRSEQHDWELSPHRHARLHQVLFMTSGGGTVELDGTDHNLPAPCFVNIPRGVVHGYRFEPETSGWVATFPSDLLDHSIRNGEGVRKPLEHACVKPLPTDLRAMAETLYREYHGQNFARAQLLRSLAGSLTALVARYIYEAEGQARTDAGNPIFSRFEILVETHFRTRRPLADYASDLAVSPTHLNRIVHQVTGQSASHLVNERMLREARRMLLYTSLSAAQIAYELGFSDPAHFSRVFTKGTGMPPRRFRTRLGEAD